MKIIKRIRELKGADEVRPIQNNNYEELPDVDAYEAEQRRLFQQAVSEFRGNKGEIKIENHSIKESNNVVSNPGNFLFNVGSNLFDINSFAYCEDKGTGPIKFLPLNSNKTTCWACFKYILIDKSIGLNDYYFCDDICLGSYKKQEMKTCECGNTFERSKGIVYKTSFYCGEECFPKPDPITIEPVEKIALDVQEYDPMYDF